MRRGEPHYSRSRVQSALGHFIFGKLASGALGIVWLVLVVRWLPQHDYGAYAALVALQITSLTLSSFGIEPATERFVPEVRVAGSDSKLLSLVIRAMVLRVFTLAMFCLLFWILSPQISSLIGVVAVDKYSIAIAAWIFLWGGFQSLAAVLEALLEQRWSQVAATVASGVRLSTLILIGAGGSLEIGVVLKAEVTGSASGLAVAALGLHRYFQKNKPVPRPWPGLGDLKKRLLRFAFFNYCAQGAMQCYGHEAWRMLCARILGLGETARYGLVVSLMEIVQRYLPAQLLMRMIRPIFISRYAQNKDFGQLNLFASVVLKLNLLLLAPLVAASFVVGNELLPILIGSGYKDLSFLFGLVLILLVPASHQWVISIIANTLERNFLQFQGALVALAGLPVGLAAVQHFGLYGILCGVGASSMIYNIFVVWRLRRMGFAYAQDLYGMLRIFLSAALSGSIVAALSGGDMRGTAMAVFQGIAILGMYLSGLLLLKPMSKMEAEVLAGVLPERLLKLLVKN